MPEGTTPHRTDGVTELRQEHLNEGLLAVIEQQLEGDNASLPIRTLLPPVYRH
jgi:hypothetical protein